jgi:hypothetical protein
MAGPFDREIKGLLNEDIKRARAERRLVEHELTRRRVLLGLTVLLVLVGVVAFVLHEPMYGAGFVSGGALSCLGSAFPGGRSKSDRNIHPPQIG